MGFYRTEDGAGWMHIHLARKRGSPASCVALALESDNKELGPRCGRMSVALCDAPVGKDLAGKVLTCDAPMCENHRTSAGKNVDYCPRHKELAS